MSVERNLGLVQRDGGGKYCKFYIASQGEEPMELKKLCCLDEWSKSGTGQRPPVASLRRRLGGSR